MTAFEKEKYFHPANTSRKSVPAHNMAINNAADSGKEHSSVWVARLFLSIFFFLTKAKRESHKLSSALTSLKVIPLCDATAVFERC